MQPNQLLQKYGPEGAHLAALNEISEALKELKSPQATGTDPRIDMLIETVTKMHAMLLKDSWLTKFGLDKIIELEEKIKKLEEPIFKKSKN